MKSVLVVLLSSVVSAVVAASVFTVMAEGGDSAADSRANAPWGDAFTYLGP